ncbi:MAG: hypothetical protein KGQ49_02595 [Verrucomicrobia bacterium]|nr:hypothetical protein [Verrucomicrobiota bacterium]MBU6446271.1 hypothetical protein [Verrucomicrobiota bacterium]MDE3047987.1 hypothetical protein [Verrucomicrobiota bacterium]
MEQKPVTTEPVTGVVVEEQKPSVKNSFEWNVERLFANDPKHVKTWGERILAVFLALPVLILDLGRGLAYSVDLIQGKSWDILGDTSKACQGVASKVSSVFHSVTAKKELSLEEQNERSQKNIQKRAEDLIDGYKNLNGGYFHTNSSFSSPFALKAEKQIRQAKEALIQEVNAYVARNAASIENFRQVRIEAHRMVEKAIYAAAKDEFYIANKTERRGQPPLLRDVALREFLETSFNGALDPVFSDKADESGNFAEGVKKGLETGAITRTTAIALLHERAGKVYQEALPQGMNVAETALNQFLNASVEAGVINSEMKTAISNHIQPDVEVLASAAAREIARANTVSEEIRLRLVSIAGALQKAKRLRAEDVSQFLTSADVQVKKEKQLFLAEQTKAKAEAERMEVERAALAQKTADQEAHFSKFQGLLNLIAKKQNELAAQIQKYDDMDVARGEMGRQMDEIRNEKVLFRGSEKTVLEVADEYYKAISRISTSDKLTSTERKEQLDRLNKEEFGRTTVERILALDALRPKMIQLVDDQARLADGIEENHHELVRLKTVYGVFRKNQLFLLDESHRKAVEEQEKGIRKTHKLLNDRHNTIRKTGLIDRLKTEQPAVPVNRDPMANNEEVEKLLQAERQGAVVREAEKEEGTLEFVPTPRSFLQRMWDTLPRMRSAPIAVNE